MNKSKSDKLCYSNRNNEHYYNNKIHKHLLRNEKINYNLEDKRKINILKELQKIELTFWKNRIFYSLYNLKIARIIADKKRLKNDNHRIKENLIKKNA